jgi:hypothetical protein
VVRFQQWLDHFLSGLVVPFLFLIGMMLGTASYFVGTDVSLNAILANPAVAAGIAAAIAAEALAWLLLRRMRSSYDAMSRTLPKDPKHEALARQFKVYRGVTLFSLAFSGFNSVFFLAGHWVPVEGTIIPDFIQLLIRGLIIPALFLSTAFLLPVDENLARLLNDMHSRDLRALVKAHRKNMNQRIKSIRKAGGDLAPIIVAYSAELGEHEIARRTRLLAEGIAEAESSPRFISTGEAGYVEQVENPVPFNRYRKSDRTAEEAREDAETVVRNLLAQNPQMTRQEIMRRGKVAMADVDFWRPTVLREMGIQIKSRPKSKRRRAA